MVGDEHQVSTILEKGAEGAGELESRQKEFGSASGWTSPVMSFSNELLPAPLGPRTAALSPWIKLSEKSCKARVSPRQTLVLAISMIGLGLSFTSEASEGYLKTAKIAR